MRETLLTMFQKPGERFFFEYFLLHYLHFNFIIVKEKNKIFTMVNQSINQDILNAPANKVSRWHARQRMDENEKKIN